MKKSYRWKHARRALTDARDETVFRAEQQRIKALHQRQAAGVSVYYFDETGLSLIPVVPYAWLLPGTPLRLLSARSQRLNVLGFMSRDNHGFFHTVTGTVGSAQVLAAFDAFAQ